ncbi:MAG: hypothetical protein CMJ18_03565 [Phycisphaeraceae bacterium]|nr:hypothetical protein [Phycisphaeraceae bacterium]
MNRGIDVAVLAIVLGCIVMTQQTRAGSLQAPPGLFKDVNDQVVGDAVVINGTQLFVDDRIIAEHDGVVRKLNQPVKHPKNPFLVADKPWEEQFSFSSVMYDEEEGFFKMWYGAWLNDWKKQHVCYATSSDGITWKKPITTPWNAKEHHNKVFGGTKEFNCSGVFKDPTDPDGEKRYKMVYSDYPDGTSKTASSSAAYSPDGIHWVPYEGNPLIPFSDAHCCPFWDARRGRYVCYLRYGPPNSRMISMTESEDFVNWSPKITLFRREATDQPFSTALYQMEVMPYGNHYFGFISTYHGETIEPIPPEKVAWADKLDVQLAYSRDGRVWRRVGPHGAIDHRQFSEERDWAAFSRASTFIPWGEHGKDWDWGWLYVLQAPIVVGDEIRIYYTGGTGRHWAPYHGDENTTSGIGLATLRRDGFVSLDAEGEGTMTTRTLMFVGDALEINADASGGSIRVEALDPEGKVIAGFSRDDCKPITTDDVHAIVQWGDATDCHQIQATPIRLRFYLDKAKLYSFTPRIMHQHYVPSYD